MILPPTMFEVSGRFETCGFKYGSLFGSTGWPLFANKLSLLEKPKPLLLDPKLLFDAPKLLLLDEPKLLLLDEPQLLLDEPNPLLDEPKLLLPDDPKPLDPGTDGVWPLAPATAAAEVPRPPAPCPAVRGSGGLRLPISWPEG